MDSGQWYAPLRHSGGCRKPRAPQAPGAWTPAFAGETGGRGTWTPAFAGETGGGGRGPRLSPGRRGAGDVDPGFRRGDGGGRRGPRLSPGRRGGGRRGRRLSPGRRGRRLSPGRRGGGGAGIFLIFLSFPLIFGPVVDSRKGAPDRYHASTQSTWFWDLFKKGAN